RSIIFDTGAIISLSINNLLWLGQPLKEKFKGEFFIPKEVKLELVDNPLQSLKFKLEALQVLAEVAKGNLKFYEHSLQKEVESLGRLVNSVFEARGRPIKIAHEGELAVIALAKRINADALVIDERTIRALIEDPKSLGKLLESRLHTEVRINKDKINKIRDYTKKLKVIRSAELGVIAYEMGLMDRYVLSGMEDYAGGDLRKKVLEGMLWGLKFRGCAISQDEIVDLLKLEGFTPL
ncbi:MAG: hypothetical protein AABY09_03495, partial [Nanoarchaeota archaeon]